MTLKTPKFRGSYSWTTDNLLEDFYIPALSNSNIYDRLAGYFCSNSLASAFKGLYDFLENGGKMRIIANVVMTVKDQEVIKKAILEKEEEILGNFLELPDHDLKKDHLKLLSWLIKKNRLEIKISNVPGAIEHKKMGILKDDEGNIISFTGSTNETVSGWLYNDESFHVHCSWIDNEFERHVKADVKDFERMWDGKTKANIYPISEAFKKGLIKNAPRNKKEFQNLISGCKNKILKENNFKNNKIPLKDKELANRQRRDLFYYQKQARDSWIDSNFNGFFEMATGTGKTFTAIASIKELLKIKKGLSVIISVPSTVLVNQWKEELVKEGVRTADIVTCSSKTSTKWPGIFRRYHLINSNKTKFFIITYQSLSKDKTQDILNNSLRDILLIADEMHRAGAPEFSKCLNKKIKYRLGLSATPTRMLDEEGNDKLFSYFGKQPLFVFDLGRALKEINPITGETYLCPYNYHIKSIELSAEEHKEFRRLSRIIGSQMSSNISRDEMNADKVRALLISCASQKIRILDEIIKEIKSLKLHKKILFYSQSFKSKDLGEKQIESVKKVIDKNNLNYLEYTSKIDNIGERNKIIKALEEETVDAVVAIKCLDEGVDIPSIRTAIILASSSNSSEFIQRRGRVLRRSKGKPNAEIYDFIVGPPIYEELKISDITLIKREYSRAIEYSKYAINGEEARKTIYRWLDRYNLEPGDLEDESNE